MLTIMSHSKNFDSQTALQMIFENSANVSATCSTQTVNQIPMLRRNFAKFPSKEHPTSNLVERVPLRYSYLTILEETLRLRLA